MFTIRRIVYITITRVAHFECIESRSSLCTCAHVKEPVSIYDEVRTKEITLWPNSSPLMGYCLRESLAVQLQKLVTGEDDDDNDDDGDDNDGTNRLTRDSRPECSAHNADWILVRKRASQNSQDSSFNFVCRCKYPHLMTNKAGPMSSCSRAVGCNNQGRLDADSRASLSDPFVNGRCDCDDGVRICA